jgi:hypothetical protein
MHKFPTCRAAIFPGPPSIGRSPKYYIKEYEIILFYFFWGEEPQKGILPWVPKKLWAALAHFIKLLPVIFLSVIE